MACSKLRWISIIRTISATGLTFDCSSAPWIITGVSTGSKGVSPPWRGTNIASPIPSLDPRRGEKTDLADVGAGRIRNCAVSPDAWRTKFQIEDDGTACRVEDGPPAGRQQIAPRIGDEAAVAAKRHAAALGLIGEPAVALNGEVERISGGGEGARSGVGIGEPVVTIAHRGRLAARG
jgi:hypothetical protein